METERKKAEQWSFQRSDPAAGLGTGQSHMAGGCWAARIWEYSQYRGSAEGNMFTIEVQWHFKILSQEGQIKL